jgi:hypothetical protein
LTTSLPQGYCFENPAADQAPEPLCTGETIMLQLPTRSRQHRALSLATLGLLTLARAGFALEVDGRLVSGHVTRVGIPLPPPGSAGSGQIHIAAEFRSPVPIDLSNATVTLEALLDEQGEGGAGELTSKPDGTPLLPLGLAPNNSANPFAARFVGASGARPEFQFDITRRPRDGDRYLARVKVNRIPIATVPLLCPSFGQVDSVTEIETRFTVDDGQNEPFVFAATGLWRCATGGTLRMRAVDSSSPPGGGSEPRAPEASLGIQILSEPAGLVRLDGARSSYRDGVITTWRFDVRDRHGLVVFGPLSGAASSVDATLAPGAYVAHLGVTDNQGLTSRTSRSFSLRGEIDADGEPPRATLRATVGSGGAVRLDGSDSSDSDGAIVSWAFQLATRDGAVVFGPMSGSSPTLDLTLAPGEYYAVMVVTDDDGLRDGETRSVSVR